MDAQEGDLVLLVSKDYKTYLVTLEPGTRMQTHRGMILHGDLIGQPLGREELLLRPYKAVPARLRPMDRMIAHTGYLVFARKVLGELDDDWFNARRGRDRAAERGTRDDYW